jgi:ferric-dicitrate binding protein FerR (iron transport regulator)
VGVACLSGIWQWLSPTGNPAAWERQVITVESGAGMRSSFRLPDSTVVYLNSGSRLTYPVPFGETERRLELQGEAYFRVKHDDGRPFLVDIPFYKELTIKALGTEFNVEAYGEDGMIRTTLVSGSLQIRGRGPDGKTSERILIPSEKATYFGEDGRMEVNAADIVCDTGWMSGKIILKNTPLQEMLRKLAHHYNVDFIVEDAVLETYSFTGVFFNRTLSQVLDYLGISSGIDYRISLPAKDDSESICRETVVLRKRRYGL